MHAARAGFLALAAVALMVGGVSVQAAEKFIPKGHSYAPDSYGLPPLNSEQDQVNAQADIYETEIYRQQYSRKLFDSDLDRFMQHDLSSPGPRNGPTY